MEKYFKILEDGSLLKVIEEPIFKLSEGSFIKAMGRKTEALKFGHFKLSLPASMFANTPEKMDTLRKSSQQIRLTMDATAGMMPSIDIYYIPTKGDKEIGNGTTTFYAMLPWLVFDGEMAVNGDNKTFSPHWTSYENEDEEIEEDDLNLDAGEIFKSCVGWHVNDMQRIYDQHITEVHPELGKRILMPVLYETLYEVGIQTMYYDSDNGILDSTLDRSKAGKDMMVTGVRSLMGWDKESNEPFFPLLPNVFPDRRICWGTTRANEDDLYNIHGYELDPLKKFCRDVIVFLKSSFNADLHNNLGNIEDNARVYKGVEKRQIMNSMYAWNLSDCSYAPRTSTPGFNSIDDYVKHAAVTCYESNTFKLINIK